MADADGHGAFDIARAPVLADTPHGFFGSSGPGLPAGVHQFGFSGSADAATVSALRARAASAVCADAVPVTPYQVHGCDVVTVLEPWPDGPSTRPEGDAVVTARPGLALGVVTADCAPVLLVDREAGVIGAAHAGWKGAVAGVVENTVAAMTALGARHARIAAAIGPTIAQASYEVDAALRAHFAAEHAHHFVPAPRRDGRERWRFDLPGYVAQRLQRAGVERIADLGHDTYARADQYHSYRRQTHAGRSNYCNQISLIALSARG